MELERPGRLLALLANIRLGWKGFAKDKISSLFGFLSVTKQKSFIVLKLGACIIKLNTAVIYGIPCEARVFVPGKPFQPSLMFVGKAGA
jgi:hypothetical protein